MPPINQRSNQDEILTFIGNRPKSPLPSESNDVISYGKIFINNLKFEVKNKKETEELFIDCRTEIKIGIFDDDEINF